MLRNSCRLGVSTRTLGLLLGVAWAMMSAAHAWAAVGDPISINFGWEGAVDDLAPGEAAGVVPLTNWNNTQGVNTGNVIYNPLVADLSFGAGGGGTGSKAALIDATGASTVVNAKYHGGGGTEGNFPNLSTAAVQNTPNAKMMYSAHSGYINTTAQGINETPDYGGVWQLAATTTNGPKDNKVTLENLAAQFPNGYQVYVYLNGSGAGGHNEQNNAITAGNGSQMAAPLYAGYGPAGTNAALTAAQNGLTQIVGSGAGSPQPGIESPGVLPAGAAWYTIWPTRLVNGVLPANATPGTGLNSSADAVDWSASFDGTYVDGSAGLNKSDNYFVLDYDISPESNAGVPYPRNNSMTNSNSPPAPAGAHFYAGGGSPRWDDPLQRGPQALDGGPSGGATPAPGPTIGNYFTFTIDADDLASFNTLDIFARPINGERTTTTGSGSSGAGVLSFGGITGIQIVGLQEVEAVPEPSTLVLAGFGLAGLLGLAWRRQRSAICE